jgi:hypothetical protein
MFAIGATPKPHSLAPVHTVYLPSKKHGGHPDLKTPTPLHLAFRSFLARRASCWSVVVGLQLGHRPGAFSLPFLCSSWMIRAFHSRSVTRQRPHLQGQKSHCRPQCSSSQSSVLIQQVHIGVVLPCFRGSELLPSNTTIFYCFSASQAPISGSREQNDGRCGELNPTSSCAFLVAAFLCSVEGVWLLSLGTSASTHPIPPVPLPSHTKPHRGDGSPHRR